MDKVIYMACTLDMMPREELMILIPQGEIKSLEDKEYLVIINSQSSENADS